MNTDETNAPEHGQPAEPAAGKPRSRKKKAPAPDPQAQAAPESAAEESTPVAEDAAAAPVEPTAQADAQTPPAEQAEQPESSQTEHAPPADRATPAQQADDEAPVAIDDVLSGRFDAEADAPAGPPKRVLLPQPEQPKLHKVLAQAGLGSRLEMEQLILEGRISVNNQPAHIGQRIQFGDQVKVHGKPIKLRIAPPPARVLAYHKPVGEVVTHDDPQNRPTVFRKLPRLAPGQGKWQSVGRLDLNTEGLLLFTNSGELANRLMHPRFGLEREYAVRVLGALSDEEKQRLLDGVMLDDGPAQFGSVKEEGTGDGANQWYRVTISEGRNREVRRMIEAVGHAVSRLIRIRYGAMLLPRGLRRGQWMELGERDIRALGAASGTPDRVIRGGRDPVAQPPAAPRRGRGDRGRGAGPRPNVSGGRPQDAAPRPFAGGQRRRGSGGAGGAGGGGGRQQPDPLKTSQGYIGADSYNRQRQGAGRPGQGKRRGGPGGFGGGPRSGGAQRGGRGR